MGMVVFVYLYVLSKQFDTDMTSYNELVKKWAQQLEVYEPIEAEMLVHWLLEHHLGLRRTDMTRNLDEKDLSQALLVDFDRLKKGDPIQYIIGKAPFYGREFFVTPATLIPRNETEELVHLIINENKGKGLKILDIGTGTGCIPISLKLEMNDPLVFGLDISEDALEVARKNSKEYHAEVEFFACDILREEIPLLDLDIVISNPPYIPEQGKTEMHRNVLDYEPGLALFVPDKDPLLFYRAIGKKGKSLLKKGGKLYYEIHEYYGNQVIELLENLGYSSIQLIKDLNGKDRMVSAVLG